MAVELYLSLPNGVLALVFSSKNCVISLLSILVFLGVCIYTGFFTTCVRYCRRWFPMSLWSKKFI